jgi:probable glucitol transport protein GutA
MFPLHRHVKERFGTAQTEKVSLKKMFKALFKNKYMLIFYGSLIICQVTNTLSAVTAYFARYCLGSDTYTTVLYLAILVPTIVFAIVLPKLTKKIDKFKLLYLCIIGNVLSSLVSYFLGYDNLFIILSMTFVRGIFYGAMSVLLYIFTSDMVEYGHFVTGDRVEALAFSVQTFSAKVVAGLCTSIAMFILAASGFVEGLNAVQPQSAIEGIWFLMALFPVVGGTISLITFRFYRLRDKDVQIMAECNNGRLTKAEAETQLSVKI